MKINSKKREGNKFIIEAEEAYSEFEKAIEGALDEAGKQIKIPGFRKGKAPKNMVENAINRDYLEAEAAQDLISKLYPQIIKETEIEPVDYPKVDIVQKKKKKPFVFKIEVDVYPEVKLGKYKGLKVDKVEAKITDEEIDKILSNLQNRFATAGPEGKKEVPPLDDEFAKKISKQETMAKLKEEIRESVLKDRTAASEADVKNKLIAEVSSDAKVEIPQGMIEREISIMLDELRSSLAQSGLTLEDYLKGIKKEEKALREEFGKSAEVRVKGKVILRAVSEAEKMKIADDEQEEELKKIAETSGEKIEDLKKRLDESAREYIQDYMLRRKALDFLMEKAKIKVVEPPKQEEEKK